MHFCMRLLIVELVLVVREIGLVGFDDLGSDDRGNFFIALEAELEGALRLRHGAQIRGVLEHVSLRHFAAYATNRGGFISAPTDPAKGDPVARSVKGDDLRVKKKVRRGE